MLYLRRLIFFRKLSVNLRGFMFYGKLFAWENHRKLHLCNWAQLVALFTVSVTDIIHHAVLLVQTSVTER